MKQGIFLLAVMIMSIALVLPAQSSFGRGGGTMEMGTAIALTCPCRPTKMFRKSSGNTC